MVCWLPSLLQMAFLMCSWKRKPVSQTDRQTDTGSACSSIKGLKLFQFLRGQIHPSSAQPVSFLSVSVSSLPFAGSFMKPAERDLFVWDTCCLLSADVWTFFLDFKMSSVCRPLRHRPNSQGDLTSLKKKNEKLVILSEENRLPNMCLQEV